MAGITGDAVWECPGHERHTRDKRRRCLSACRHLYHRRMAAAWLRRVWLAEIFCNAGDARCTRSKVVSRSVLRTRFRRRFRRPAPDVALVC